MNTPSHLIINAALHKRAKAGGATGIARGAFLLGAVLRFRSPLSYWDANYFGREFTIFEMLLNAVLLVYLVGPWL